MTELDIVRGPLLEQRAEVPTLGIRETVPFRTMLAERDRMLRELIEWLRAHDVEPSGPFFLRLYVVDMAGEMQIEVGVAASSPDADGRVVAGVLPAGEYAVLSYRNKSMAANKMLRGWIEQQGVALDVNPHLRGEAFACRCEIYLTDPRSEPRKTRWVVELAFKTREP